MSDLDIDAIELRQVYTAARQGATTEEKAIAGLRAVYAAGQARSAARVRTLEAEKAAVLALCAATDVESSEALQGWLVDEIRRALGVTS